jgi:hypothetical protein
MAERPGGDHSDESALLRAFGTGRDQLLRSGGESEVFALDHDRVLRLYRSRHEAPQRTAAQLRGLYESWRGIDIGIELPAIIDAGSAVALLYRRSAVLRPELLQLAAGRRYGPAASGAGQLS